MEREIKKKIYEKRKKEKREKKRKENLNKTNFLYVDVGITFHFCGSCNLFLHFRKQFTLCYPVSFIIQN